jgi:hypothetical protein
MRVVPLPPHGHSPHDGSDPAPPDPRHRPVVLFVPPRAVRSPRDGIAALLPVAAGICVLVVSLLFGTLISAWAGWRVAVPDAGSDTSGILRVPAGPAGDAPLVRVAGARAVVDPVPAAQDGAPPADGGTPAVPDTGSTPASHEARAVGLVAVITAEPRAPHPVNPSAAGPTTAAPETPSSPATASRGPTASQPPAAPTANASPTSSAPTRSGAPALAPTSRPAPTTGTPSTHVLTPPRTTTTPEHGIGDGSRTRPRTTPVPAMGGRGGHPDGDHPDGDHRDDHRDDQRGDGRHHHGDGASDGDGRRDHASPAHPTGGRPADSAEDRRQPSASRQPQR